MKNFKALSATMFLIIVMLTGCLKDKATRSYRIYTPVYQTLAEVRANIKSNSPRKIENAGKIFVLGKYIFLNEVDRGIHIIDNSSPVSPRAVAFIDIPGNVDLAVKDNILYADLYSDLVALDVSDPLHVVVKKVIQNAFPERRYANGFVADSSKIIVDWLVRDTMVDENMNRAYPLYSCATCSFMYAASSLTLPQMSSVTGVGGSMARFAIINQNLFTVGTADLGVYSISNAANPEFSSKVNLGWGVETIYPFKDRLFIGSSTGMFIYDVSNPASPSQLGQFSHFTSCDPVIADDNFAFVTLSSGTRCSNASNQVDVLNVSDLKFPSLIKSYPLTNPHGLSKNGNTLFICDGTDGLKVYDAADVNNLKLTDHITGFEPYDVIAFDKLTLVVSKDGLREFDYSDPGHIKLLSRMVWAQ